jgi:hypothetical protein
VHRRKLFSSFSLSILGLALLCYLAGAVVVFFQLPSSEFLTKAFVGARDWYNGERASSSPGMPDLKATPAVRASIDQPQETFDGFTLYATLGSKPLSTQALLINMRREVVHRWAIEFSRVWPSPPHLQARLPDILFCFFACHLYPNGDLLAVLHGKNSPVGCGLIKLNSESKLLWAYPATIHHDVDVAEDGTIYTIQQELVHDLPDGLERISTPCEVDHLLVLSPEGELVRGPISILAAFQDTPYAELLEALKMPTMRHSPPPGSTTPRVDYQFMIGDPLHTNSVKVLSGELAGKFPLFKAGQVLLSIRDMCVLAVIDPESAKVVWAARGPWYAQHDVQFLGNGHLLFYDNLGIANGSRVLEYDPRTQAFPWSYDGAPGAPFYSSERGACQRLPNGNTFIVNSEGGEMLEVTQDKKVVWSSYVDAYITTGRRYAREELPFLGTSVAARP